MSRQPVDASELNAEIFSEMRGDRKVKCNWVSVYWTGMCKDTRSVWKQAGIQWILRAQLPILKFPSVSWFLQTLFSNILVRLWNYECRVYTVCNACYFSITVRVNSDIFYLSWYSKTCHAFKVSIKSKWTVAATMVFLCWLLWCTLHAMLAFGIFHQNFFNVQPNLEKIIPYPTFFFSLNIIFDILLSSDWDCVKELSQFVILTQVLILT